MEVNHQNFLGRYYGSVTEGVKNFFQLKQL